MVAAFKENKVDPLTQLRKMCKLGIRAMNITADGAPIVLRGEKNVLVKVQEEDIVRGKKMQRKKVHRVMLTGEGLHYTDIGWVIDGDVKRCMSCASSFGIFTWRHHCRLCGDALCGSCSSKRVNLEAQYRLGEGTGSRVCSTCFNQKSNNEERSHHVHVTNTKDIDNDDKHAQENSENQENTAVNGSRVGIDAYRNNSVATAAGGGGGGQRMRGAGVARAILAERKEATAPTELEHAEYSALSPVADGVAIAASDLEAPTPDPKSVSVPSNCHSSSSSSSAARTSSATNPVMVPKGILKLKVPPIVCPQREEEEEEGADKATATTTEPVPMTQQCMSPTSALLDSMNGRWDRSDDGMSTPGSVTSMMSMNYSLSNTAVTTPEHAPRMHGGGLSLGAAPAAGAASDGAGKGDKYYFTPASASHHIDSEDAEHMLAGSASVLRREQIAAHNAKLNVTACREDLTNSAMGAGFDQNRAQSVDYFTGTADTGASYTAKSPQNEAVDMMYSPLQPSPANSSMVTMTPSPLPNTQHT